MYNFIVITIHNGAFMSIEEKLDVLIDEVRLLRAEMHSIMTQRRPVTQPSTGTHLEITKEAISGLKGMMTAGEVCFALGIEYTKSNTTIIGTKLNRLGVNRKRTKATRLFDFGGEDMGELGGAIALMRDNIELVQRTKNIADIAGEIYADVSVGRQILISKALRHIGIKRNL